MHTLIIGLDGLNWPLLEPLPAAGLLPTLARLPRERAAVPPHPAHATQWR